MATNHPIPPSAEGSWVQSLRRHPVIVTLMLVCTVVGVILGVLYLDPGYSLFHRVLAGAVAGAGCGLIIAAPRMVGP